MKQVFKRAILILCSAAMVLSTIGYANAGGCGAGALTLQSAPDFFQALAAQLSGSTQTVSTEPAQQAMTMPCCVKHTTAGMNTPCHCSAQNTPAAPRQNLAASLVDHQPDEQVIVQPWHVNRVVETIATQLPFLVADTRLRAPPERIYILNCSLLR